MDLLIVGPGRAGGSIVGAAREAGHRIVGVLSRSETDLEPVLGWDEPLPPADLGIVAVSDTAITEVARRLRPVWHGGSPVVHLSGFTTVEALAPLGDVAAVGSFHPLQTFPDAEQGARSLSGAWAAVTADEPLAGLLRDFARSLGMRPFALADGSKPLYHAAASAGANYVVETLAVAADLLDAAGVPLEALQPLTRQVVDNVFRLGPQASLTGPIARRDLVTVAGQQRAADSVSEDLGRQFRYLSQATALRAGLDPDEL